MVKSCVVAAVAAYVYDKSTVFDRQTFMSRVRLESEESSEAEHFEKQRAYLVCEVRDRIIH